MILTSKVLRSSSTNLFLLNLSVADLLVLVTCTPTTLVEIITRRDDWILGKVMDWVYLLIYICTRYQGEGPPSPSSKLKKYISKIFHKPQPYHLDFWLGSLYVTNRKDTKRHDVWRTHRSSLIQFLAQFRLQQKFSSGTKSNTIQSQIANLLDFSWHFIMK